MNAADQKAILQYLSKYSHAITAQQWQQDWCWKYVLIIPVCGESADFLTQVMQHHNNQSVLVIVVINRPENHPKTTQWRAENEALLAAMNNQAKAVHRISEHHRLLLNVQGIDLLLLNFNAEPFHPNKGVGLARKIAADTGLQLINNQSIECPWIFSTDADVVLPVGYFNAPNGLPNTTAGISLDFKHISDDAQKSSVQAHYDFKLRYYQTAMRFMSVQYDYIPLGSTLIVRASEYAKVRGFPSRSGGEDFYLLNKLAKRGAIHQPQQPIVNISIRFSERVPFGTGPALIKINNLIKDGQKNVYYHPEIFHVLKKWRVGLINYFHVNALPLDDHGLNSYWSVDRLFIKASQQIKSEARWIDFIHEWFDAFKILKSVHYLGLEFNPVEIDQLHHMPSYTVMISHS